MGEMFNLLKEGLTDALGHAKGKKTLRSKTKYLPKPPKQYNAKNVKDLRKKLNFSQHVLALYLNVSVKTVQAWELGKRSPNSISNRFLDLLASEKKRDKFYTSLEVDEGRTSKPKVEA